MLSPQSQQPGASGTIAALLSASLQTSLAAELVQSAIASKSFAIDTLLDWKVTEKDGSTATKRRTLCMIAAQHGCVEVLSYLLSAGAAANFVAPDDAYTALHCAAEGGSPRTAEVIALLLQHGAVRDALDGQGRRPVELLSKFLEPTPACESPSSAKGSAESDGERCKELDKPEYQTAEFRMYCFKIKKCPFVEAHDWTECPYAHPGEKARRRDPRKFTYCGTACPDFRKGTCKRGDPCPFAHGVFECWLHPSRFRTQLCKDTPGCTRRVCFFAHSMEELRQPGDAAPSPSPTGSAPDIDVCGADNSSPVLSSPDASGAADSWGDLPSKGGKTTAGRANSAPTPALQQPRLGSPPMLHLPSKLGTAASTPSLPHFAKGLSNGQDVQRLAALLPTLQTLSLAGGGIGGMSAGSLAAGGCLQLHAGGGRFDAAPGYDSLLGGYPFMQPQSEVAPYHLRSISESVGPAAARMYTRPPLPPTMAQVGAVPSGATKLGGHLPLPVGTQWIPGIDFGSSAAAAGGVASPWTPGLGANGQQLSVLDVSWAEQAPAFGASIPHGYGMQQRSMSVDA